MPEPIWTVAEARAADEYTVKSGVSRQILLNIAGFQLARYIRSRLPLWPIVILTGPGSNGGDGWVASRHLARWGPVTVIPVAEPRFLDASEVVRAAQVAGVKICRGADCVKILGEAGLVVDAIYGTGFHGSVRESPAGPWLQSLSDLKKPVAAIDLFSGIDADTGAYGGPEVQVRTTITMGSAKWGHVAYPGTAFTGALVIADIGLIPAAEALSQWIDPDMARAWMPSATLLQHKYTRGHVVVIGGSRSMPGAPMLAAMAALKAGAGLAEVVMPASAAQRIAASPALIVHGVDETSFGDLRSSARLMERARRADALVVGPGLGPSVQPAVMAQLLTLRKPMVIDADGIALLGQIPLERLPPQVVITPHAGELGRLLGTKAASVNQDRRRAVLMASDRLLGPVLLKGHFSLVAHQGRIWVNPTGSPALATAGSGDVLSGMVARLLASGLKGERALALASYWHGWAGELGAEHLGMSLTATDLLDWIGPAARAVQQGLVPSAVEYWQ